MRPRMVVKNSNPTYHQAAWHVALKNTKCNFCTGSTERLAEPKVQRYRPFVFGVFTQPRPSPVTQLKNCEPPVIGANTAVGSRQVWRPV